jgi:hypothetical protein
METRRALACYWCFFLLLSSGRLSSADAGEQLQASILLATTGHLGAMAPPPSALGWQQGPGGAYYEPHDIGGTLLMVPAAMAGHLVSGQPAADDFNRPPIFSRLGASLTYALLCGVGCLFLFRLFSLEQPVPVALLLGFGLALTTPFGAYAKTAWDVTAGACGMCAVLYTTAVVLRGRRNWHDLVALGSAVAITSAFRYSLAPFLIVGVVAAVSTVRPRLSWREAAIVAGTTALGFAPSLAYNFVRTGSPLLPATATASYLASNNALTGNIVHGFLGVLFAPNRGLFVFAPACLLLFALPLVWRRVPREDRRLLASAGGGVMLYVLFIARLKNWGGTFGWGPRFLIPIVPVVYFGAALAFVALWDRWHRWLVGAIVACVVATAPALLVNWSLAIVVFPQALDQEATTPAQHAAVWRTLANGLNGEPLPLPENLVDDAERRVGARFPDIWIARVMERSRPGFLAGLAIALVLVGIGAYNAWLLCVSSRGMKTKSAV